MNLLSDESVHLIITSPPYWQLKDYGVVNQIGYYESYESYINNMNLVWNECHRVLHPGCRLCINVGDQFARSVYYGRYKVIPIRTEIIKFCEIIGFDYMGAIIWQKVTTTNTTGGATIMGSFPYPRNGILKLDYEFILLFKKQGKPPKPTKEQKELSAMTKEEWNTYFSGHWYFAGAKQDGHIAMFPEELPSRLIKMFAFIGDTVLDPFLGSGTTSLAAHNLGRNSVGYEINPEFIPIIERKLNISQTDIAGTEFVFLKDSVSSDLSGEIEGLPYLFKDPHSLDKKIDPKKLQFGSRIDKDGGDPEKYFSIKEVISPEMLKLDNGLLVRLLGIREKKSVHGQAVQFLIERTTGQKVFLKFDACKYHGDGNLQCYLYLKNRTFINAHLIKAGLVDVDNNMDYKFKNRFQKMAEEANG
ncbi:MAG: site-specific DNA-methyltransferase [candidate division Zixibacteria bacterium]|nr:site-specific DNA-methyltransferase [candidate division Zixibacteria bacterium]MBU1469078.1 site-specific DNA-methyltransferase [candidate division Zixibacteria bacterium]MBU2624654.1 site-specific DNA-methyltransferase [candidate division Zixibacteria bacterium]